MQMEWSQAFALAEKEGVIAEQGSVIAEQSSVIAEQGKAFAEQGAEVKKLLERIAQLERKP
jgi:uncharacterized coiled-coil protein SlyX